VTTETQRSCRGCNIHDLCVFVVFFVVAAAASSLQQPPDQIAFYTDKQNLLVYLDSAGKPHPVKTAADWEIRRSHVIQSLQLVMGRLPEPETAGLDIQILATEELGNVRRLKITFRSEGEDRVPAFLLIPHWIRKGTKAPGILCLHQTTPIGKAEPTGLGGKPNLHYALELAERSFVTLAPDYPNSGDYKFDSYAHDYVSATMKAIVNHRRAIDLLQSLPEVDPEKIAVIGHSLGGHNALFLAAFDRRVKAVVTSCGFTSFRKYMGGNLSGWSHKGYMPRIAEVYDKNPARMPFDFTELLACLAPRPVFISAPVDDSNFEVSGVRDCVAAALPVYRRIYKAGRSLKVIYPPGGHDFPPKAREAAYRFLAQILHQRREISMSLDPSPLGAMNDEYLTAVFIRHSSFVILKEELSNDSVGAGCADRIYVGTSLSVHVALRAGLRNGLLVGTRAAAHRGRGDLLQSVDATYTGRVGGPQSCPIL